MHYIKPINPFMFQSRFGVEPRTDNRPQPRQMGAFSRESGYLDLKTREGDLVTFSTEKTSRLLYGPRGTFGDSGNGNSMPLSYGTFKSVSFSAMGNFNDNEFADIRSAISTLGSLMDDFFTGGIDELMDDAGKLFGLDSIAELEAGFSSESIVTGGDGFNSGTFAPLGVQLSESFSLSFNRALPAPPVNPQPQEGFVPEALGEIPEELVAEPVDIAPIPEEEPGEILEEAIFELNVNQVTFETIVAPSPATGETTTLPAPEPEEGAGTGEMDMVTGTPENNGPGAQGAELVNLEYRYLAASILPGFNPGNGIPAEENHTEFPRFTDRIDTFLGSMMNVVGSSNTGVSSLFNPVMQFMDNYRNNFDQEAPSYNARLGILNVVQLNMQFRMGNLIDG